MSNLQKVVNNVLNEEKLSAALCEEVKQAFGVRMPCHTATLAATNANYELDVIELTHVGHPPKVNTGLMIECLKHSDEQVRKLAVRLVPQKFSNAALRDKSDVVRNAAAERADIKNLKEALSMWPSDDQMRATYLTRTHEEPTIEDSNPEEILSIHAEKRIGDAGKQQKVPELSDAWYATQAFKILQDYDGNIEYSWEKTGVSNFCNAMKATSGVEIDREKLYKKLMELIEKRDEEALELMGINEAKELQSTGAYYPCPNCGGKTVKKILPKSLGGDGSATYVCRACEPGWPYLESVDAIDTINEAAKRSVTIAQVKSLYNAMLRGYGGSESELVDDAMEGVTSVAQKMGVVAAYDARWFQRMFGFVRSYKRWESIPENIKNEFKELVNGELFKSKAGPEKKKQLSPASLMVKLIDAMRSIGYKVTSREKNSGSLKAWLDRKGVAVNPEDEDVTDFKALCDLVELKLSQRTFAIDEPYIGTHYGDKHYCDMRAENNTFKITLEEDHDYNGSDMFIEVYAGKNAKLASTGYDVGDLGESRILEMSSYEDCVNKLVRDPHVKAVGGKSFVKWCNSEKPISDEEIADEASKMLPGLKPDVYYNLGKCIADVTLGIHEGNMYVDFDDDDEAWRVFDTNGNAKGGKFSDKDKAKAALEKMSNVHEADDIDAMIESVIVRESYEPEEQRLARWEEIASKPENKPFIDAVLNANDPKELARAKRAYTKADDNGECNMPAGVFFHYYDKRKKELASTNVKQQSSHEVRKDWILRMRDSSGKAIPRKFR